jgi:hypothetical protein
MLRSEGPEVNSPVREGGEPTPREPKARRAGTNRRAPSALSEPMVASPALTDGAINFQSFGPKTTLNSAKSVLLLTLDIGHWTLDSDVRNP